MSIVLLAAASPILAALASAMSDAKRCAAYCRLGAALGLAALAAPMRDAVGCFASRCLLAALVLAEIPVPVPVSEAVGGAAFCGAGAAVMLTNEASCQRCHCAAL